MPSAPLLPAISPPTPPPPPPPHTHTLFLPLPGRARVLHGDPGPAAPANEAVPAGPAAAGGRRLGRLSLHHRHHLHRRPAERRRLPQLQVSLRAVFMSTSRAQARPPSTPRPAGV